MKVGHLLMIYVKQFVNSMFSSNTYAIFKIDSNKVWIIDPGDSIPLMSWIMTNKYLVKGILLTHYHIDHIYGVNDLKLNYPGISIYASPLSLEGLYSPKLNG